MKNICSFFLIFLLITGCVSKEENVTIINHIKSFKDTLQLKGEKIPINDPDVIFSMDVFDTMLVFNLHPFCKSPYYFRAYNLNNYKIIGDFVMKGGGSGELINAQRMDQGKFLKDNKVYIWIKDFPSKIVLLNLTASLETGKSVIEREYNFIHPGKMNRLYASNFVFSLGEDVFLMDRALDRSGNSDESYSGYMYIMYDAKKDKCLDTLKYNYALPFGWSCMNEERSKIISISYRMDMVSLYDINKKRQLILCQTYKEPEELYELTSRNRKLKVFNVPFVYSSCLITDSFIMALFKRNKLIPDSDDQHICYVHIFDTEGKPLYNLVTTENLETICYDKNTSILYGMDEENQLYTYDLKEVLK